MNFINWFTYNGITTEYITTDFDEDMFIFDCRDSRIPRSVYIDQLTNTIKTLHTEYMRKYDIEIPFREYVEHNISICGDNIGINVIC